MLQKTQQAFRELFPGLVLEWFCVTVFHAAVPHGLDSRRSAD